MAKLNVDALLEDVRAAAEALEFPTVKCALCPQEPSVVIHRISRSQKDSVAPIDAPLVIETARLDLRDWMVIEYDAEAHVRMQHAFETFEIIPTLIGYYYCPDCRGQADKRWGTPFVPKPADVDRDPTVKS